MTNIFHRGSQNIRLPSTPSSSSSQARTALRSSAMTTPSKKIFVTTDASDRRTGAVLSFGESWDSARPVAFDSYQLNAAEKNYPTHERELLAIVKALKKWRSSLLGVPFEVHTDHPHSRILLNRRKTCPPRQLRWSTTLADFDYTIVLRPRGRQHSRRCSLSHAGRCTDSRSGGVQFGVYATTASYTDTEVDPHLHWRCPIHHDRRVPSPPISWRDTNRTLTPNKSQPRSHRAALKGRVRRTDYCMWDAVCLFPQ